MGSVSQAAVAEAVRRKLFARVSSETCALAETLADDIERLLVRALIEALAMAAKAGQVVTGFAKVEDAIARGQTARS